MSLKAVLFDFNGVIIKDEWLHEQLMQKLLIEENICPQAGEYQTFCLGRSDRACFTEWLGSRGRCPTDAYLDQLIARKARFYQRELEAMEKLPIYPGLEDLIFNLRAHQVRLAVVSGALRSEVEMVLERTHLRQHFSVIVAGDDITASKPDPEGYLVALQQLQTLAPELHITPQDCLVIEDTLLGIQAARAAGMGVVGVANTYPFHMLQRQCNWVVDYLSDLEIDRVQEVYQRNLSRITT